MDPLLMQFKKKHRNKLANLSTVVPHINYISNSYKATSVDEFSAMLSIYFNYYIFK